MTILPLQLCVTFRQEFLLAVILCIPIAFSLSCVNTTQQVSTSHATTAASVPTEKEANRIAPVDINSASASELEKLPGVGELIAKRIVEHRERYGSFRRPEHLIIVRGMGEGRYKALRPFVKAE